MELVVCWMVSVVPLPMVAVLRDREHAICTVDDNNL